MCNIYSKYVFSICVYVCTNICVYVCTHISRKFSSSSPRTKHASKKNWTYTFHIRYVFTWNSAFHITYVLPYRTYISYREFHTFHVTYVVTQYIYILFRQLHVTYYMHISYREFRTKCATWNVSRRKIFIYRIEYEFNFMCWIWIHSHWEKSRMKCLLAGEVG